MAVFYKKPEEMCYAVNARVDAINYSGQLEGKRISALISYSINGTPRQEWIDFWNGTAENSPKLYDQFKKFVKKGDKIVVLCKGNTQGYNSYALKFIKEGNSMIIDGESVFFGCIDKKEVTTQIGPVTTVAVKTPTKNIAMRLASWNKPSSDLGITVGENYIVIAHSATEELTPDGRRVVRYIGDSIFPNNDLPVLKNKTGDILINIGCYEHYPKRLDELLNVPEEDKKRVLAWMHYVADEWDPNKDEALIVQKNAISDYLKAIEA